MNNEVIIAGLKTAISKHVGNDITKDTLKALQDDLQKALDGFITDETLMVKHFPIDFENEMGKWHLEENGKVTFQPKVIAKYITVDIKIEDYGR